MNFVFKKFLNDTEMPNRSHKLYTLIFIPRCSIGVQIVVGFFKFLSEIG